MIQAVIFDLDGLLIDSEPLWSRAETQVFGELGIQLGEEQIAGTLGMGLEEVVKYYFNRYPWGGKSRAEVAKAIHQRVLELFQESLQARPGAREVIDFIRRRGVKIGLATASDRALIEAALGRLGLLDMFDHIQSSAELPYGKPHPEVYLRCAQSLGVAPERCVGLEDSLPGLIAIKAAKMKAIVVPDKSLVSDPRLAIADVVLGSLLEIDQPVWDRLSE